MVRVISSHSRPYDLCHHFILAVKAMGLRQRLAELQKELFETPVMALYTTEYDYDQ